MVSVTPCSEGFVNAAMSSSVLSCGEEGASNVMESSSCEVSGCVEDCTDCYDGVVRTMVGTQGCNMWVNACVPIRVPTTTPPSHIFFLNTHNNNNSFTLRENVICEYLRSI